MRSLPNVQAARISDEQSGSRVHLETEYTTRTACGFAFAPSIERVSAAKWKSVPADQRCIRCASGVDSVEALGLDGALQALALARSARKVAS